VTDLAQKRADGAFVKRLADNSSGSSLATHMRRARFALFLSLLRKLEGPVRVLDIGGTQAFWNLMAEGEDLDAEITLLNLRHQPVTSSAFTSATGDARNIPQYADKSFDVVFSNSVIEHVGSYSDQKRMANEVLRVGRRYFVQTPNKRFPLEPHFIFPFFQYLPMTLRAQMLHRFDVGWYKRVSSLERARAEVESIQLLTRSRFAELFPGATIYEEKLLGLTKSFVAYGGWES
jgi:2-polyprenyl-3-methyl-5-hydroxy-6-metoxy-1,4-benzoquinol methylase